MTVGELAAIDRKEHPKTLTEKVVATTTALVKDAAVQAGVFSITPACTAASLTSAVVVATTFSVRVFGCSFLSIAANSPTVISATSRNGCSRQAHTAASTVSASIT